MSETLHTANYNPRACALRWFVRELDLDSERHAFRAVRQLQSGFANCWKDKSQAPIMHISPGRLPEAEDGIHKYNYYMN